MESLIINKLRAVRASRALPRAGRICRSIVTLAVLLLCTAASGATVPECFFKAVAAERAGETAAAGEAYRSCVAETAYAPAAHNLGNMILRGDLDGAAARWFQMAAQKDFAPAQVNLAYLYAHGIGVSRDARLARQWYRRAASSGNAQGQHNLGLMLLRGEGGEASKTQAARWFRAAAEQDHVPAMLAFGEGLREQASTPAGDEQALYWLAKAARAGNASGAYLLGLMYGQGRGVDQDYSGAAYWYTQAAIKGHLESQYLLCLSFASGKGMDADPVKAWAWCDVAASRGHRLAAEAASTITPGMTGAQIEHAAQVAKILRQERVRWPDSAESRPGAQ